MAALTSFFLNKWFIQSLSQLHSLNCNCFKRKSPAASTVSLQGLPMLHVNRSSAAAVKNFCGSLKSLAISGADWETEVRRRMGSSGAVLLSPGRDGTERGDCVCLHASVLPPAVPGCGYPEAPCQPPPHPSLVVPGSGLGAGKPSPSAETQIPFAAPSRG